MRIRHRTFGLGGLVQHDRSGLLFPVGDAAALRRALQRLIDEPGLLGRLREGLPRVPTIEEDASATRTLYARVARAS